MTTPPLWLQVAAAAATVAALLVPLAKHIKRAFYLLTHAPQLTVQEHEEQMMLRLRMGWVQKTWDDFLYWCRTETTDRLTWGERWARRFFCPLAGHDISQRWKVVNPRVDPAAAPLVTQFGTCKNCNGTIRAESPEAVDDMARPGRLSWEPTRVRERD